MSQATDHASTDVRRRERYRRLAARLREWMQDDSGYDERVGPILAEELARDGLRLHGAEGADDH